MEITRNEKTMRFESPVGEEFAYIEYRWYRGTLALMHTFVPPAARGTGLAEKLAATALDYARDNGHKIMIYCSYIAKYIKAHPEYEELKDKKYHQ